MRTLARFLLAFFRLFLLIVLTLLTVIIALPCFYISGRSRKVSNATARIWGRSALFLMNVKVNLMGERPNQKVLVMPNHQNYLDVFLILAYYPASIVAKKEIGQWPLFRFAIKLGRIILVDRTSLKGALQAMRDIDSEIDSGGSVILFPEGTTYEGPLTKAFKPGTFKVAAENRTPIIPVAIKYLTHDLVWRDETFLNHFVTKMGYWRTEVDLWFGTSITEGDTKSLLAQTKSAIDAQLSKYI